VLYSFCPTDCSDGISPFAGLSIDAAGNLYGTTEYGGNTSRCGGNGCGTVFQVGQNGSEKTLYKFHGSDGQNPVNGLLLDASGNLYGTTPYNVYEVTASGTFEVLYAWQEPVPNPSGTLIMDDGGNLYGTTTFGGGTGCDGQGCGTVFKFAPDGTETVLGSFSKRVGLSPAGGVIADPDGYLYGTTFSGDGGGCGGRRMPRGCGTVFRIPE
jgi:uncharacterized repeat protein (TIGR03803 family)